MGIIAKASRIRAGEQHVRRKVWFVGRSSSDAIEYARVVREESRMHFDQPVSRDIGYAQRVAGIERTSALLAPFRAPHHSVGSMSMTGKLQGHEWQPGELALAHGGVLVLADATEFGLGPLGMVESAWRLGCLRLSSSVPQELAREGDEGERNALVVPTWFSLVVHTQPCPCGSRGQADAPCLCSERDIEKYHAKVRSLVEGAEVVRS